MKKIITIACLLLFVFGAVFVPAEAYDKGGYHKSKGMSGKIMFMKKMLLSKQEELVLTDEQVDKIKEICLDAKKTEIKADAEIDILALDIKAMMYDDVIDTEAINGLIDNKYEAKKAKAKAVIAAIVDMKSLLSEDQVEKLKELKKTCTWGGSKDKKCTCKS